MDDSRLPAGQPPGRQPARRRRRWRSPLTGPDAALQPRRRGRPDRAPTARPRSTASRCPRLAPFDRAGRAACCAWGRCTARGRAAYLAVRGGLDVPAYFGSRATFMLGGFGGHGGRALRAGDVLRLGGSDAAPRAPVTRPVPALPEYPAEPGRSASCTARTARPTSSPPSDIETFFATDWRVHHNSDRTGVRLIGPQPDLGPPGRRRGRPAPVEHPRQRLRRRHHRLHRRHADHPRPRRPQPGRLRLPRHHRPGRALEDGPAQGRRQGALPPRDRSPRRPRCWRAAGAPRSSTLVAAARRAPRAAPPAARRLARSWPSLERRRSGDPSRWSTAGTATTTCWSSTARWCSTWRCASASTP